VAAEQDRQAIRLSPELVPIFLRRQANSPPFPGVRHHDVVVRPGPLAPVEQGPVLSGGLVAVEAGEPRGAEGRREARPLVRCRVANVEAGIEAEKEETVAGAVDVEAAAPRPLVGEPDDGPETVGAEVKCVDAAVRLPPLATGGAAEEGDEGHRRLVAVVVGRELAVGDDPEPVLANGAEAEDGPGRQAEEDVPYELLGQVRGHGSRGRGGLLPLPRTRGALHGRQRCRRTPHALRFCKTSDAFVSDEMVSNNLHRFCGKRGSSSTSKQQERCRVREEWVPGAGELPFASLPRNRLPPHDPTTLTAYEEGERRVPGGWGLGERWKTRPAPDAIISRHNRIFETRDIERVCFGFFLASLSEKLAVGKSWLLGKAGG
jgi:hypothetical protein